MLSGKELGTITVQVTDQDKALAFYTQKLKHRPISASLPGMVLEVDDIEAEVRGSGKNENSTADTPCNSSRVRR